MRLRLIEFGTDIDGHWQMGLLEFCEFPRHGPLEIRCAGCARRTQNLQNRRRVGEARGTTVAAHGFVNFISHHRREWQAVYCRPRADSATDGHNPEDDKVKRC